MPELRIVAACQITQCQTTGDWSENPASLKLSKSYCDRTNSFDMAFLNKFVYVYGIDGSTQDDSVKTGYLMFSAPTNAHPNNSFGNALFTAPVKITNVKNSELRIENLKSSSLAWRMDSAEIGQAAGFSPNATGDMVLDASDNYDGKRYEMKIHLGLSDCRTNF